MTKYSGSKLRRGDITRRTDFLREMREVLLDAKDVLRAAAGEESVPSRRRVLCEWHDIVEATEHLLDDVVEDALRFVDANTTEY